MNKDQRATRDRCIVLSSRSTYAGTIYRVRCDGWHAVSLLASAGGEHVAFSGAGHTPLFVGASTRQVQRRVLHVSGLLRHRVSARYYADAQEVGRLTVRINALRAARAAFEREGWSLTASQTEDFCALLAARHTLAGGLWDQQAALCHAAGLDDTRPPVVRRINDMG